MKEKNTERKMLRTDWKELPIDKEKSSRNVCKSKIISYLCSALHSEQRGKLADIAGIFYARTYRFCTPLQSVNAPAAVQDSVRQRVGAKPFFFAHHTYCLTF